MQLLNQIQQEQTSVFLGAQNIHPEREGAYTGELSLPMFAALGAKYVLCGHSERRYAGETNSMIANQVAATLKSGLTPVLCVGETQEEKEANKTLSVLSNQITEGLRLIPENTDVQKEILIAYEPRWAIGTGLSASKEDLASVFSSLSKVVDAFIPLDKNEVPASAYSQEKLKELEKQGFTILYLWEPMFLDHFIKWITLY